MIEGDNRELLKPLITSFEFYPQRVVFVPFVRGE